MAVNMKGIWSRQCGLLTTSDWCAAVNPKIINQLTFKKIQWHTFSTNRIRSIFLIIGPSLVRKLSCFFHFLQCPQYWYLPIRVNICAQVKISKQPDDSRTGIGHERTVLIYENTIRPIFCLLFESHAWSTVFSSSLTRNRETQKPKFNADEARIGVCEVPMHTGSELEPCMWLCCCISWYTL